MSARGFVFSYKGLKMEQDNYFFGAATPPRPWTSLASAWSSASALMPSRGSRISPNTLSGSSFTVAAVENMLMASPSAVSPAAWMSSFWIFGGVEPAYRRVYWHLWQELSEWLFFRHIFWRVIWFAFWWHVVFRHRQGSPVATGQVWDFPGPIPLEKCTQIPKWLQKLSCTA